MKSKKKKMNKHINTENKVVTTRGTDGRWAEQVKGTKGINFQSSSDKIKKKKPWDIMYSMETILIPMYS